MEKNAHKILKLRSAYFFLFVFTTFIFPWYVPFVMLIMFTVLFNYEETLLYAFLLDLLWSPRSPFLMRYSMVFSFFCLFVLVRFLRGYIRTNTI